MSILRSSGSSTSAPRPRPPTAASSIHSPSTKSNQDPPTATAQCPAPSVPAPKQWPPANKPPKCTPLLSSVASKPRLPSPDTLVVPQAPSETLLSPASAAPQVSFLVVPLPPTRTAAKCRSPPNTHTARRRSTHTTPTPKTRTRSASPSTRSWKYRTSAADGGRLGKQTARPALRPRTTSSSCDRHVCDAWFLRFLFFVVVPVAKSLYSFDTLQISTCLYFRFLLT